MSIREIENMRRSAAMSSLSIDDQRKLLDACAELTRERAQIAALLAELPTSWSAVRRALNELQRLVREVRPDLGALPGSHERVAETHRFHP